jgi:glycosyltransferase involved in cell wall biosynthesis
MRIGILTSSLDETNGWGRYTLNLTGALSSAGNECVLFSEEKIVPNSIPFKVFRLHSRPGSGATNIFRIIHDALRLRRLTKNCDIIHTFTETHAILAWLIGKPYVISTHGTYTLRFFKHVITRWLAIRAFNNASAVIVTSEFTHAKIEPYVKLKKTILLPNGVNSNLFHRNTAITRNPHTFITVGAIKPRKGQDMGVKATALLRDRFPDIRYFIVGRVEFGAFNDELHKLIKENNLENNVVFEQNVSDTRLVDLYSQASVFVLPSRVDSTDSFEGYPLTLLEASACELPIIGSRGCGAEHLINEGQNGYLITSDDVSNLVSHLELLFSNPEATNAMGQRAFQVASKLSWTENAKNVINLYHSIIRTPSI